MEGIEEKESQLLNRPRHKTFRYICYIYVVLRTDILTRNRRKEPIVCHSSILPTVKNLTTQSAGEKYFYLRRCSQLSINSCLNSDNVVNVSSGTAHTYNEEFQTIWKSFPGTYYQIARSKLWSTKT